jgi:hypothetical protein
VLSAMLLGIGALAASALLLARPRLVARGRRLLAA